MYLHVFEHVSGFAISQKSVQFYCYRAVPTADTDAGVGNAARRGGLKSVP